MTKAALILVDVRNDFLPPDGSLAVPNGRDVLPILQQLLNRDQWDWAVVLASQDYHPEGHISFASTHDGEHFATKTLINAHGSEYEQVLWPDHCVIGTKGAEIDKELRQAFPQWDDRMKIVQKGRYSHMEQYSVFEGELNDLHNPKDEPGEGDGSHLPKDAHIQHREVARHLRDQGVEQVVVVGLATDFCVLFTAESAIQAQFKTCVVAPAVRGIKEDGVAKAFEKIRSGGGTIIGEDDEEGWDKEVKGWLR